MSRATQFAVAAAVCALLAGWLVLSYTASAERKAGPGQKVLVAAAPMRSGAEVGVDAQLTVRTVPARFAPPDALGDPAEAVGQRLQVALPAGAFLTQSMLSGGADSAPRFKLRSGERAVTVDVVISPIGEPLEAGDRVDLYASGFGGDQQTEALIEGAEVLTVAEGGQPDRSRPTVRIETGQVAAVVRADVFAHELRAVLRG
ncbi:MAG: hypothetical protein JHC98_10815 [Thermoleophilaceae bacterium]|nr:hypothetical protein [Thermoleophilaceae bacterium]